MVEPSLNRNSPPPGQTDGSVGRQVLVGILLVIAFVPVVYRLSWRSPDTRAAEKFVTIQYMAWGYPQQLDTERAIIRRFNDMCVQTGKPIRVELFVTPGNGYLEKLQTMLASGTAPDVARVDNYNFSSMAARGFIRDLTNLAGADPTFSASDFHPAAMRENYYRGRLYGMNVLFGGITIYYNKDLFRRAGLSDPYDLWRNGKWNWEAFDDAASRLTSRDTAGRTTSFSLIFPPLAPNVVGAPAPAYWALWLWRHGTELLSPDHQRCLLDTPAAIDAISQMRSLIYGRHVCPTQAESASNAFSFESGNVAMGFDWAGVTPRYRDTIRDFQWDVIPPPIDSFDPYTMVKGNQLIITSNCTHPHEAWEWVKFMTSRETESYLCGDALRRSVPTRIAVLNDPHYLEATAAPFHTDVFPFILDHARELPIDQAWPVWTNTAQKFMDYLFTSESADTETTLRRATQAIDVDIMRYRQNEAGRGN
jgi:multiple sugar transport system substrate-binding protein